MCVISTGVARTFPRGGGKQPEYLLIDLRSCRLRIFLWSALKLRVTLLKHRERHKLCSRPYHFCLLSGINIWHIHLCSQFSFWRNQGGIWLPPFMCSWLGVLLEAWCSYRVSLKSVTWFNHYYGRKQRTVKLALHHFLVLYRKLDE
jgi:hypothetical protein